MASGPEVMQMLMQRGLSPQQAAILAGHMAQESGFNPSALNQREGAYGLIQHRLDRRDNLNKFAAERGVPPSDVPAQLDFILSEMRGSEAKRGGADFLGGGDLPTLHAALKRYIRYGDNSDAARMANAQALLGGRGVGAAPPAAAPFGMAAAAPAGQVAPQAAAAPDPSALMNILRSNLQDAPQEEPAQFAPVQMARPLGLAAARRLLASLKGTEA